MKLLSKHKMTRGLFVGIVFLFVIGMAVGCSKKSAEEASREGMQQTPEVTESKPQTQEDIVEEAEEPSLDGTWDEEGVYWIETEKTFGNLSKEECDAFTRFFQLNNGYGFLLSDYDQPENANLSEVFYTPIYEDMTKANIEEADYDCWTVPVSEVNERILKFTGLTNEKMTRPLYVQNIEGEEVVVCGASDSNYRQPNCIGGYYEEGVYTLLMCSPFTIVTLTKPDDEHICIISNHSIYNHYLFEDETKYNPNKEYEDGEIDAFSYYDLFLLKNEYYARHGMIFKNPALKLYFESLSWYEGTIEGNEFDDAVFNEVERANIDYIISLTELMNSETALPLTNEDLQIDYQGFVFSPQTPIVDIMNQLGYPEDFESNEYGYISDSGTHVIWELNYPNFNYSGEELRIGLSTKLNDDYKTGGTIDYLTNAHIYGISLIDLETKRGLRVGDSLRNVYLLYGKPDVEQLYGYDPCLIYSCESGKMVVKVDQRKNIVSEIVYSCYNEN